MVLFDLAEASWFPLVMVFGIGVVMFCLYLSMRREIRKISVPPRDARPGADESADR
ncbi:hypothetical protein [Micropruina sonneratiae]|uniref:hypothetical protein n=1 Tax=Micropruina sonneratiae TaxID=2986940 RepID=UPI002225F294|nr:hypothetical protein [Micropruina sp. KQZ13P-5]MCW3158847.1 hypothetical protein [Micropruina sp. KQZ13P-5]